MNKLLYIFMTTLFCMQVDAMEKVLVRQKNQKNIKAVAVAIEEKEMPLPTTIETACEDIDAGIRKFADRFYWAGQNAIDYNNQQYGQIDRMDLWLQLKKLAKDFLRYDENHSIQRDLVMLDGEDGNSEVMLK